MTISREDAAAALRDVESVKTRAVTAHSYRVASGHLILWGLIWLAANLASWLLPQVNASYFWLALCPVGAIGGVLIGRRVEGKANWRVLAALGFVMAFATAVFSIADFQNGRQYEAFMCLLVALLYMFMGLWVGARFVGIGLVVTLATVVGFYALYEVFYLWMGLVGGGALLVGGLWLRRA